MSGERNTRADEPIEGLGWMLAAGVGLVVVSWLVPVSVCVLTRQTLPRLSVADAVTSGLRLLSGGHGHDPAGAYPAAVHADMPGPTAWWVAALATLTAIAGAVAVVVTRFEPHVARERLGRRAFDVRGASPRTWARPRDLRLRRGDPGGFSVGQLDGRPVSTDEQSHIAVIAPTRAGKTTRCVIPWLLEHDGPVVITSTKRDVLDAAKAAGRKGRIWVFDPFGDDSMRWTPLFRCDEWAYALRQAQWLADASSDGSSEIARFWRGESAKLLAPLIHAAALAGRSMAQVLAWLDEQNTTMPLAVLKDAGAGAARRQLQAVAGLDDRNRGTTYMSAGAVLAVYRHPDLYRRVSDGPADVFTPDEFVSSERDALFIVAAERDQQLLAPLVVSLISSVVHDAIESGRFRETDRRLRVLLDEAANIAPLPDLARLLSQAAGHGLRVATIWQSIAQVHERHGRGADTILANSGAKLLMGPITDEQTRRYALGLLHRDEEEPGHATAASLQQLERGRALFMTTDRLPAVVALTQRSR